MSRCTCAVDRPSRDRHEDRRDDVLVARDAPLQRAQRHHDDVVLVAAERELPLRLEHADDVARDPCRRGSTRRAGPGRPNSSLRTVLPMHADGRARSRSRPSVERPRRARAPSCGRRSTRCRCRSRSVPVVVAVRPRATSALGRRRDRDRAEHLALRWPRRRAIANGGAALRAPPARRGSCPGSRSADCPRGSRSRRSTLRASRRSPSVTIAITARDADHDAEHGERPSASGCGAARAAPSRGARSSITPSAAAPRPRPTATCPSRNRTTRRAYAAMSGSCVTITIVMPRSLVEVASSSMISWLRRGVEVAGRLVGEQQRRLGHQRARDRDALLLAARELGRRVLRAVGEPDRCERLAARAARRSRARTPPVDQRQLDVLERGRARQQVEALEHEAEVVAAQQRALVAR